MLTIDRALCAGCGTCLDACPTGAISLNEDNTLAVIDLALCDECLACLDICPNDAIQLSQSSELMPSVPVEVVEAKVVEGEIMPAPFTEGPVAIREPSPLAALAGTALSFVGSWFLPRAANALMDAVERRLVDGGSSAPSATPLSSGDRPSMRRMGSGKGGGPSRQRRRRRRG